MKNKYIFRLVLFISILPSVAFGKSYALIMGISNYPVQPLPGVKKDIITASHIAKIFGIDAKNITTKKDNELTLSGMRDILRGFEKKITSADKVFIYFSGHGTRYSNLPNNKDCKEAIVTHDMKYMDKNELLDRLISISAKSKKTFVFLDSCFSGGMVTRGKGLRRGPTIKFFALGQDTACSSITNLRFRPTRDFGIKKSQVIPNYYLLLSAASNEIAIDGGTAYGGLATSAFYKCVSQQITKDLNNDSIISLREIKKCTQNQINKLIDKFKMENVNFPYTKQTIFDSSGPGGNIPIAFKTNTLGASNSFNFFELLKSIQQNADASHLVTIDSSKKEFKIGRDSLKMSIKTNKGGYLTIISVGSSGKIFRLFPNKLDLQNQIIANQELVLPRSNWEIPANGPEGTNHFLAIVSDHPYLFVDIGSPAGPFSRLENTPHGAKILVDKLLNISGDCRFKARDFGIKKKSCVDNYGVGVMDVQEVF